MIFGRHAVQFFGPVRANRDDLVSKRAQLFFDCDKIRQMGVAIRTPGTSIEHQPVGFPAISACQVTSLPFRSSKWASGAPVPTAIGSASSALAGIWVVLLA